MLTVAVLTFALGIASLVLGVIRYLQSKRAAKLFYTVHDVPDFGPVYEFYGTQSQVPVGLSLENAGNKEAENVQIGVYLNAPVESYKVETLARHDSEVVEDMLKVTIPTLNRGDKLLLKIICRRPDTKSRVGSLVRNVDVTCKDGRGVNGAVPDSARKEMLAAATSVGSGLKAFAAGLVSIAVGAAFLVMAFFVGVSNAPQVTASLQKVATPSFLDSLSLQNPKPPRFSVNPTRRDTSPVDTLSPPPTSGTKAERPTSSRKWRFF